MAAEESNEPMKLKILALHGYRQNGNTFKMKTGAIRKAVSRYAQLIFITAPHRCEGEEEARSWWFNDEERTFSGKCLGGPALGFEEAVRCVERAAHTLGPFDGLLGFSQGACLVALLAALQRRGALAFRFRFAVLISGFVSGSLVHRPFYDEPLHLPSLHIYGESDSIIPKEMSEALVSVWGRGAQCVEHGGGHYVPSGAEARSALQAFLLQHLHPPRIPTPPPPHISAIDIQS